MLLVRKRALRRVVNSQHVAAVSAELTVQLAETPAQTYASLANSLAGLRLPHSCIRAAALAGAQLLDCGNVLERQCARASVECWRTKSMAGKG